MTSPYGGDQLVWPPPGGGGNPFGGEGQHYIGQVEEVQLPSGRVVLQTWVADVDNFGRPTGGMHAEYQTSYNDTTGGGVGGGVSAESYALDQQQNDYTQQHYQNMDAIDALTQQQTVLNDAHTQAVNEGNLALARQIEARMAANEAQRISLEYQQQTIDAALGQAQVGANVYGTQTQGRSSQLSTLATMAQAAGEAQANPWNPLGYLDLVNASGGGTPYSNATPETQGVYGNQMAQNWQNTYGAYMDRWNQGWEATNQTPQYIQDALAKMVPLQAPAAQTPAQVALARYQRSTQGEKAALAGATPEQLRLLWEAGQVR
jgi:hypothetical protein